MEGRERKGNGKKAMQRKRKEGNGKKEKESTQNQGKKRYFGEMKRKEEK